MDEYTPDLSLADVLWKHRLLIKKRSWFSGYNRLECACGAWSTFGYGPETERVKEHIDHQTSRVAWWAMKSAEELENANHRLGK